MKWIRAWFGRLFVRLGLWLAPPGSRLTRAAGDDLTRLGAQFGVTRETDEEFRARVNAAIRPVGLRGRGLDLRP